jgi:vancomycin resistance protein YoaR
MSNYTATRPIPVHSKRRTLPGDPGNYVRQPQASPLLQAFLAITAGFVLFFILLIAAVTIYDLRYVGKIYPGVMTAGVDLSGLTQAQAAALLAQHVDFPDRGRIVFKDGNNLWTATPRDLGLYIDNETTAKAAFQVGRVGGPFNRLADQLQTWYMKADVPPLMIFDQRVAYRYLSNLASKVNRPILEASLGVNGVDVVVNSGQVGRSMDVEAALRSLDSQLRTLSDGIIPLVIHETPPVILDASAQAELARKILSAPLTISVPNASKGDPGPWKFEPDALANMLVIERVTTGGSVQYQVGLDSQVLKSFLERVAPKLERTPQNARFTFNDDTHKLDLIQNAVIGRNLDIDATIQDINTQIAAGEHNIPLHIATTQPAVRDDATATSLGIKNLVSEETTYFYGSSAARIQNIKTAASRFNGVLVPPGAVFSMADTMGDVSLDNGYAEALIIYGDRTIEGVGGGVCQVSTTLFRTVFFGGYPIVERYSHAYRVGYYEQTASGGHNPDMAGLDATVFVPMVDFKFKNDSSAWLLMETYTNGPGRSLTWKFYSTADGRKVDWETSGPQNIVPAPDPLYEENPDLAKGEIEQVDYSADGSDVTISRTVTRDGQVIDEYNDTTHYLPWRAVYQYGPGTKNIPTSSPTEKP